MLDEFKRKILGGVDRIGIYCNDAAGGAAAYRYIDLAYPGERRRAQIVERPSEAGVPYVLVHHTAGLLSPERYDVVPIQA